MKVPNPRKLKSGTWFIQLRLNGVSVPVTASTKTECINQARLIKAEHKAHKRRISQKSELTIDDVLTAYIERKEKSGKSPSTIRGYETIRKNHFKKYQNTRIEDIKNWQQVYDEDAAVYSPKSMRNAWSLLKSACASKGFTVSDVEEVEMDEKEMQFLDQEQIPKFVKAVKGDFCEIGLLLCLLSCRASEVCALDWQNVDLEKNMIYIRGARVPNKYNRYVDKKKTKTAKSTRAIPILIPELQTALQAVENKTGKVFPHHPYSLTRHSLKICKANGLPECSAHDLRRSFASLGYSLGVPIKVTMQLGGWSDYNTVLKIYTKLSKLNIDKQTTVFANYFSGQNQGAENANQNANLPQDAL